MASTDSGNKTGSTGEHAAKRQRFDVALLKSVDKCLEDVISQFTDEIALFDAQTEKTTGVYCKPRNKEEKDKALRKLIRFHRNANFAIATIRESCDLLELTLNETAAQDDSDDEYLPSTSSQADNSDGIPPTGAPNPNQNIRKENLDQGTPIKKKVIPEGEKTFSSPVKSTTSTKCTRMSPTMMKIYTVNAEIGHFSGFVKSEIINYKGVNYKTLRLERLQICAENQLKKFKRIRDDIKDLLKSVENIKLTGPNPVKIYFDDEPMTEAQLTAVKRLREDPNAIYFDDVPMTEFEQQIIRELRNDPHNLMWQIYAQK